MAKHNLPDRRFGFETSLLDELKFDKTDRLLFVLMIRAMANMLEDGEGVVANFDGLNYVLFPELNCDGNIVLNMSSESESPGLAHCKQGEIVTVT